MHLTRATGWDQKGWYIWRNTEWRTKKESERVACCIVFSTEISHDFLTPEVRKEFRGWNFSLTQLKISCAVKVVYSQSNWFIYGLFLARMKIYTNPMIQRLF